MTEKKIPKRFESSGNAIKAVQVAFDTSEEISKNIRLAACHANISPSDQIRAIVGLDVSTKPIRTRLSVSFSEEDYKALAKRYGLTRVDKLEIKRKVAEELYEFARGLKNK